MSTSLLPHQPPQAADEASARALLDSATEALRTRRLAEVAELRLAIQWSVAQGHPRSKRDPMVTPGGDGTPAVREHAIPELAMARETHPATTRALIADGLDLVHRLPRTWAVVESGRCEPWVARKVAVLSRALLSEQVGRVDRAVAKAISGHAPSTVLEIARAKVIEADPETHRAERERSRHERYARLSRADEFGYRHLIARVTAGDAAWIDAMVDRVADILGESMGHDHNHDELRSIALGWLARPVELLKLLLEHTDTSDREQPAWAADHMADTIDKLCALPARRLAKLRGRGRLFVHLTDEALRSGVGVARVEGVGPIDVRQLHEVLGNADVTVTPVLDLRERRRVDAYEHPEVIKDHVWIQTGGDCFPFTPRSATRDGVDYDHAIPYDDTGPPGQTGPHNSGPLRRRHHRTKTHGGLTTRVVGPGRHLWRTPHGQAFLVDHTGTTRLTEQQATAMAEAIGDGVELYFGTAQEYEPAG
ncbi:hypothetical protein SAMN05192575_105189 [Nocardioides alpinus]|uniref:DUF222 domain-containing protein n=1 Tax=Nocardioides alpinus TaxID=748909 RepID=A0A1I0ZE80_9ACTN|nr:hypothetical protein [Nocardioides alpinus]PKH40716.1 hypothetical protein CXG46_12065 [Nocardioides alpinus]SFB22850.1 hypothetical protein SAMN05192575_105189 [Nocardioides alpinus]